MSTTTRTVITVVAAVFVPASFALAIDFQLGESKNKTLTEQVRAGC